MSLVWGSICVNLCVVIRERMNREKTVGFCNKVPIGDVCQVIMMMMLGFA